MMTSTCRSGKSMGDRDPGPGRPRHHDRRNARHPLEPLARANAPCNVPTTAKRGSTPRFRGIPRALPAHHLRLPDTAKIADYLAARPTLSREASPCGHRQLAKDRRGDEKTPLYFTDIASASQPRIQRVARADRSLHEKERLWQTQGCLCLPFALPPSCRIDNGAAG